MPKNDYELKFRSFKGLRLCRFIQQCIQIHKKQESLQTKYRFLYELRSVEKSCDE